MGSKALCTPFTKYEVQKGAFSDLKVLEWVLLSQSEVIQ